MKHSTLALTLASLLAMTAAGEGAPAPGAGPAPSRPAQATAHGTTPAEGKAAEKSVRDRVAAYWKARATMNLETCFAFYEAAFRAKHTPESFARDFRRLNRFAPRLLGVDSVAFADAGKRAAVRVRLQTKVDVLDSRDFVASVEEVWLLEDGEWWRAAEPILPEV